MTAINTYTDEEILDALRDKEEPLSVIQKRIKKEDNKVIARSSLVRRLEQLETMGKVEKIQKKGYTGSATGLMNYWKLKTDE